MDQGTKDTLKKVADYADAEKKRLARRMCDMTAGALILFATYLVLKYTGLADSARPYQNLSDFALGATTDVLILNILYSAGVLDKIREAKLSWMAKRKK